MLPRRSIRNVEQKVCAQKSEFDRQLSNQIPPMGFSANFLQHFQFEARSSTDFERSAERSSLTSESFITVLPRTRWLFHLLISDSLLAEIRLSISWKGKSLPKQKQHRWSSEKIKREKLYERNFIIVMLSKKTDNRWTWTMSWRFLPK